MNTPLNTPNGTIVKIYAFAIIAGANLYIIYKNFFIPVRAQTESFLRIAFLFWVEFVNEKFKF